jgi:hypothetical protein
VTQAPDIWTWLTFIPTPSQHYEHNWIFSDHITAQHRSVSSSKAAGPKITDLEVQAAFTLTQEVFLSQLLLLAIETLCYSHLLDFDFTLIKITSPQKHTENHTLSLTRLDGANSSPGSSNESSAPVW